MIPLNPSGAAVSGTQRPGIPAPRERKRLSDGSLVKVWIEAEAPAELRELAGRALSDNVRGDVDFIVITPHAADNFTASLVADALEAGYVAKVSGKFDGGEVMCFAVGH